MKLNNTYNLGEIWENPYVRHLGIADHIKELAIIDDELRREKNRRGMYIDGVAAIEEHFRNELADLVLIALKDLPPELLEQRRKKFVKKAKES